MQVDYKPKPQGGNGSTSRFKFDFALSANTWTMITKTIPGNSNLAFATDNQNGFRISFFAFMGTTFTDSTTATDEWANNAGGDRADDMTSTWFTTNDATLEITGVQLEVGSVATDFEHRSFGQELALCQRYYQRIDGSASNTIFGVGNVDGSTQGQILVQLPVSLRAKASSMDTTGSSGDYKFRVRTTQNCDDVPSLVTAGFTQQFLEWHANGHGFSDGDAALAISGSSSSFLGFSAEL